MGGNFINALNQTAPEASKSLRLLLEEHFRRCVAIRYADLNTGPRATTKMMQNERKPKSSISLADGTQNGIPQRSSSIDPGPKALCCSFSLWLHRPICFSPRRLPLHDSVVGTRLHPG